MPRKRSKTAPKTVKEAEDVRTAIAFRRDGATLPEIAKTMKCSISTAYRRVEKGLNLARDHMKAEAGALLELELLRLDKLWRSAQKGVAAGDPGAINAARQVSQQRAKLLGLEAPVKTADAGPVLDRLAAAGNRAALERIAAGEDPWKVEAELAARS